MINTAHPDSNLNPVEFHTVFDFLHPTNNVPTYNYWPAYPTFTFMVEFTGGDPDALSDVQVITTDSSGSETYVDCTYDETDHIWIGTHDYLTFSDVPCKVRVSCENTSDDEYDTSMDKKEFAEMLADVRELNNLMSSQIDKLTQGENAAAGEEKISFDLVIDGDKVGVYTAEMLDYKDFSLDAWADDMYAEYKDQDGSTFLHHFFSDGYCLYGLYSISRRTAVRERNDQAQLKCICPGGFFGLQTF